MPEYNSDTLNLTALPFFQWQPLENTVQEVDTGIPSDSIHPLRELTKPVFRQSIFQSHTLQVSHSALQPRENSATPIWVFIVLLLIVGLQCLYFRIRKLNIINLLKAAGNIRAMDRMKRNSNLNKNYLWLPMGLSIAFPIALLVQSVFLPETSFLIYLLLTTTFSILYILRNWIFRLLGNTFENKQGIILYINSNYVYHQIEGTIVTILLFPFFYLPGAKMTMFYIIAGFLAIVFTIRFLRGTKVFLTIPNRSNLFLFYYLCIVEIIPILVIIKWFIGQ